MASAKTDDRSRPSRRAVLGSLAGGVAALTLAERRARAQREAQEPDGAEPARPTRPIWIGHM